MRPLCALRNLVRIGCSMNYALRAFVTFARSRRVPARPAGLAFGHALILRHRIVLHDLAFEDPNFDAAGAVGRERGGHPVIDVGAQRVQRHAALAIPFHARDLGAAEPPRAIDADAAGAKPHRRLHRALHRPPESDAAFELLRNRFGDQLGVEFGLADFDDVDDDVAVGQRGDLLAQLFDIGALLADDYAGARRMDCDAAFFVRPLDHDLRHRGLLQFRHQRLADFHVLVQQRAIARLAGIPARIPGAVDAETKPDRIDLLTHRVLLAASYACASTSRTTIVRFANGLKIAPTRPRARAACRLITNALPTWASATTRSSTSRSWLFSALAIADSKHLRTSRAIRLRENSRSASAVETFLPRISCAKRLSFCGLIRSMRATAFASVSDCARSRFFLLTDLLPASRCPARRRGARRRHRRDAFGRSTRCAGRARCARAFGFAIRRMAVERTRRRELAELVADHFLGDDHRDVLLPVIDAEGQPDELRQDRRAPRPDADHLVASGRARGIRLLQQITVDKRTLPDRTRHTVSYFCLRA